MQPFNEVALHKKLVEPGAVDVDGSMGSEIIVLIGDRRFCKLLKLAQDNFKFLKIAKVKMRVEQVMHALNVMPGLYSNHHFILTKKINPLLTITVVHQKI